jgi:putative heme-binding domain-containing protein
LANWLWTLDGLGELNRGLVIPAFSDKLPGNREQAYRLSEQFFAPHPDIRRIAADFVDDPSPRVRFQLALSAGAMNPQDAAPILAAILEKDAGDPWTVTAALSSAAGCGPELLASLTAKGKKPSAAVVSRLAGMIGSKGDAKDVARVLELVVDDRAAGAETALLDGLGRGMVGSKSPFSSWWDKPPTEAANVMPKLRKRLESAAATARDEKAEAPSRVRAASLLAYGPFESAASLAEVLVPATPLDVQLAVVRVLAIHTDPKVSELLLKNWSSYAPALRRGVLEAMAWRADRILKLLDAVEAKKVNASEFTLAQVQHFRAHPNAAVRAKAASVFKKTTDPDRARVVKEYAPALELKGDAARGRAVFRNTCAACHKLDGFGNDVGANLLAALPNKSGADLLVAVFDPNREVDPRYVGYSVTTADDRVLTGVVSVETPTSITLRRADGKEDVILRSNIASMRSTSLSLMPAGLEKELKPQDVADLFAYLRVAGK